MRKSIAFEIQDTNQFRANLMHWARSFNCFIILDSNHDSVTEPKCTEYSTYSMLIAAGCFEFIEPTTDCFNSLQEFQNKNNDWLFGHLCYDLKSETENIVSNNPDFIGFPLMHFFQPQWVITVNKNKGILHYLSINSLNEATSIISGLKAENTNVKQIQNKCKLNARISKTQYIEAVEALKKHIARGDIYEINYCIDFIAENAHIDPYQVWLDLNNFSPAPFSAFYKHNSKYLLCSSPERFLKKTGQSIVSQPIKGTVARNENHELDKQAMVNLEDNAKERAENIMIADLVRNDLSRVAISGTVKAEKLCDIYTFKHVHQMISTITAELNPAKTAIDAIKNTFPMGSMTGAPKHSALKLADTYEKFRRGLYSGSIGYFAPNGDFDFNVVIRSILYNAENQHLSIATGSAITAQCEAEKEYEECLLKAEALIKVLGIAKV